MKYSALDFLVCNQCYGRLRLQASRVDDYEGRPEIISGQLACTNCPRVFPVVNGVPSFVDRRKSSAQNLETGQRFGLAWKEFPRMDMRYRQQFFDWLCPVYPSFLKDKLVLEAGCGKGRHAQIIADSGAATVFAVDIGEAVEVAFQNVGHLDKVHVVQSDILSLPFLAIFDFAFSVGVLHHMDNPQNGFTAIVDVLKPEGAICIWVYGRENNWWLIHIVNPVRIAITSRMPAHPLRIIALLLAALVFVASKMVAGPYMRLRREWTWLPGLFYGDYLSYLCGFDFNEIHHIVFDHLVAPVSNYIPGTEVKSWFESTRFINPIVRWHNRNSWTGFGSYCKSDSKLMADRLVQ